MKEPNNEELLKQAAAWQVEKVGRHREEDGTVPGWHSWARTHSQKDEEIIICCGRKEWQLETPQVGSKREQSQYVSVVSWNILSDTHLQTHRAEGSYTHVSHDVGEWPFRLGLLMQWIENLSPDVLALQEVDYTKFVSDLQPMLRDLGYDGLMQKQKKKASKQPCGNATFWKNKQFDLMQHGSQSRTLCVVLKKATTQEAGHDEAQAAQEMRRVVCVANVHLESGHGETSADRRARQLNSALSYAANESPDRAVIVCGDCNTGADSQLFRVLREHQWHGHNFSSVYEHPSTARTLPVSVATFMVPGCQYVIDHIVYAQDTLQLRCALDAFSTEETNEHIHAKGESCGFPSTFCPSDHIPVGALFEILPQNNSSGGSSEKEKDLVAILSPRREAELKREWDALQAERPRQPNRKPTPDEQLELTKYADAVKSWNATAQDNSLELEYVTKLINGKK